MNVSAPSGLVSLYGVQAEGYRPHALHAHERVYRETNCYTDVLIEVLHARGDEPLAAMGATVCMDFEGDQWTFFKPPPHELELLFGIDIHEMQPYRPLALQVAEHVAAGRTLIFETDSWYLPDTRATSYRTEHVKSSIAVEAIDLAAQRLRYFHGAGLYELQDEDFRGVFRLEPDRDPAELPPYVELVRFLPGAAPSADALRPVALELLRGHLARRPTANPFVRFGERLQDDLPGLLAGDAELYHAYAFATVRMFGSAFEACAAHVQWLLAERGAQATDGLARIVQGAQVLSLRLARRRPFDIQPSISALAAAWDQTMTALDDAVA